MKRFLSLLFAVLITMSVVNVPMAVSAVENNAVSVADTDNTDATEAPSDNGDIPMSSITTVDIEATESEPLASDATYSTENTEDTHSSQFTQSTEVTESVEATEPSETTQATEFTESTETTGATETTQPTETTTVSKPKAVTDLKVTSTTANSVTIQWKKGKNATRYYIYRAVENKNAENKFVFELYKTFYDETRTTLTDKKLNSGTVYKYKVVSGKYHKGTEYVSKAVTVSAVTSMAVPKKLKATEVTTTQLTLKWSAVSNAEKYDIYRKKEGDKSFAKLVTVKTNTYTDKKKSAGTIYKYKVVATRKYAGTTYASAASEVVTVVTNLSQVKNLKVKTANTKKISISWSKVNNAKKYQIYRKSEDDTDYSLVKTSKNLTYTDKKVEKGKDYTYRVRGYRTVAGKQIYGAFASVKTSAGISGIGKVKVKSYMSKGLFTWDAVKDAEGYDIYFVNKKGKEYYQDTVTTPNYLTIKHTPGKTCTYKIKAFKKVDGKKVYSVAKTVSVKIVATAFGKNPGDTYLEVCTETQTVNMYIKGKLYASTLVVTGNYGSHDTTHGVHYILTKKTPATLKGSSGSDSWEVDVKYWLGFTYDGQGFHDSTWRTSGYGGNIYKGDGSHGCVNTPYDAMSKIFSKAYVGMPVVVY